MALDQEGWVRLYRVLGALGLDEPEAPVTLTDHPDRPSLPLGWPQLKVALHFDHDDISPFVRDDWTLVPLRPTTAKALAEGLRFIDDVTFAVALRESEQSATQTTSRHERALLDGLLHAGLPMPDRNHRLHRPDGTTLTVPDFVWADRAFAVFLDGAHWHGGRSLHQLIESHLNVGGQPDRKRRKALQERWKNKAAADAEKRRQMTAAGWTVVAVSDADIDPADPTSVTAIVADIATTYHRLGPATPFRPAAG